MKKLYSDASRYINKMRSGGQSRNPYEGGMIYAQRGVGFETYNPYHDVDRYLDVAKSAGASFLASQTYHNAYYGNKYPDDPLRAQKNAQGAAFVSGALGGIRGLTSLYAEGRDYQLEQERLQRLRANEYYRVPTDRYNYSEFSGNAFNNTAYEMGGYTPRLMRKGKKRRYQVGGYVEEIEPLNEQVVFDSTFETSTNQQDEYETEDVLPYNTEGYDFSKFKPTLGNIPTRYVLDDSDIQSTINSIAVKESGGRYDVVNRTGGASAIYATGKYQFVPKYWASKIAAFQGTQGKTQDETMEHFRNNPQIQDAFMAHVVNTIYLPEVKNLLPIAKKYGLGQDALIKMLHYRGVADTRRRLNSGNFETPQSEKVKYNNPDILSYITR